MRHIRQDIVLRLYLIKQINEDKKKREKRRNKPMCIYLQWCAPFSSFVALCHMPGCGWVCSLSGPITIPKAGGRLSARYNSAGSKNERRERENGHFSLLLLYKTTTTTATILNHVISCMVNCFT